MPTIKSISYKSRDFGGLIEYMHRSKSKELLDYIHRDKSTSFEFTYLHNIFGIESNNLAGIEQAFKENDTYRKQRSNGNRMYQDIISFSPQDRAFLLKHPEALWNIAALYLENRAPNSLGVARVHADTDHLHVHFMISANEVHSSKATHLTKEQFTNTKEFIEEYQRIHYPELTASRINHLPNKVRQEPVEKPLLEIIKEALLGSETMLEFTIILKEQGIETYKYRDTTTGIMIDGKKSRFTKILNTKTNQDIAEKLVQLKQSEKECLEAEIITDTEKEVKPSNENELQALRRNVMQRDQEWKQRQNQLQVNTPATSFGNDLNQSSLSDLSQIRQQAHERFTGDDYELEGH